ncbi:hypothetical protein SAMN04488597_1288 [Halanaerobium congolense]|uniref:Uncharacterized protein n=1 Tax=Halanaerobium congolense TaxID=54121 RepID=A0A1G6S9W0_9FIRM|nr:hypothetical protein SAMN04488597_1288 [Halanaerobium congolense]SHN09829.1 hypothetical protein SAMN04515650_12219 [Halanaerobium congolense]
MDYEIVVDPSEVRERSSDNGNLTRIDDIESDDEEKE